MVLLLGISIFGIDFLVSYEMQVHTPENGVVAPPEGATLLAL